MLKSELFNNEALQFSIEELNQAKNFMIFAASGEIEKNEPEAFKHLRNLICLENELKLLLRNLICLDNELNLLLENLPFVTVEESLSNE